MQKKEQIKIELIKKGITQAMTYHQYKVLMEQLVAQQSTTGTEITEALVNYTRLNHKRMKRLDKTLKLYPEQEERVKSFKGNCTWLVLTESWCGDAAQTMPIMHKIAALVSGIHLKIILRDEHLELMDQFLYHGGRSIPKLIAFDADQNKIIGDWGPRPSSATQLVNSYKEQNGTLTPAFKQDLQIWYNKDKGANTIDDLLKLLY